jgi:hypothetical protein
LEAYAEHPVIAAANPEGEAVTVGVWRSDRDGFSANGGARKGEPARPGLVQEVEGPLRICTANALHISLNPPEWKGERWWVAALIGPVQSEGLKYGGLKRVLVEELS